MARCLVLDCSTKGGAEMTALARRRVEALKRVVAYLEAEDYKHILEAAQQQGWSVSRYLAWLVEHDRLADVAMLAGLRDEIAERMVAAR